jgi:ribosomal protein S18 acetylase RimI-like enzyme
MRTTAGHTRTATALNPRWLDADCYVEFLNRAFPGKWNRAAFEWHFTRPFNGLMSDILVRSRGANIVSGLAICPRQVAIGTKIVDACVISAAATIPEERGRGHYTSLLQLALEQSRRRGSAAMIAFVTRENVSAGGFVRLGARAIPSFYIVSSGSDRARRRQRVGSDTGKSRTMTMTATAWMRQVHAGVNSPDAQPTTGYAAHFHYARFDDWKRQFIERPHPVHQIALNDDAVALVERVGSDDRLQLLHCPDRAVPGNIDAISEASGAAGQNFFMYTLDPGECRAAERLRFKIIHGYLLLQPTVRASESWDLLKGASWRVQSGDRM